MEKIEIHRHRNIGAYLGLSLILLCASTTYAYECRIPESGGPAGSILQIPVILDDATEVASVKVQINYDAQLLTLLSVTNSAGTLGEAFSMQYEDDGGRAILILYREDHLLSGHGVLAYLNFLVNTGAEVGVSSELVVADLGLGSERGKDLGWSSALATGNGLIQILSSAMQDSDADGIPDSWEQQHYGGATNANPSAICANGINTVRQAYIAGLNPNDPASVFLMSDLRSLTSGDVLQWQGVSGRVYTVYWTTNLMNSFQCLESNIPWTRASFTNATDVPCGFYKIDVKLAP